MPNGKARGLDWLATDIDARGGAVHSRTHWIRPKVVFVEEQLDDHSDGLPQLQ